MMQYAGMKDSASFAISPSHSDRRTTKETLHAHRESLFIVLGLVLAFLLPWLLGDHMRAGILVALTARHATGSLGTMHYAPEENLQRIDVDTLRDAQSSIEFYGDSLIDEPMISALKDAAGRGAMVCIYLDHEHTEDELRRPDLRAALLDLAATPSVTIRVNRFPILPHIKACAIDTRLLREGMANFSGSGRVHQENALRLTDDSGAIINFERSYQLAWDRPDNVTLAQSGQIGR